jgi:hypothetical protein
MSFGASYVFCGTALVEWVMAAKTDDDDEKRLHDGALATPNPVEISWGPPIGNPPGPTAWPLRPDAPFNPNTNTVVLSLVDNYPSIKTFKWHGDLISYSNAREEVKGRIMIDEIVASMWNDENYYFFELKYHYKNLGVRKCRNNGGYIDQAFTCQFLDFDRDDGRIEFAELAVKYGFVAKAEDWSSSLRRSLDEFQDPPALSIFEATRALRLVRFPPFALVYVQ